MRLVVTCSRFRVRVRVSVSVRWCAGACEVVDLGASRMSGGLIRAGDGYV